MKTEKIKIASDNEKAKEALKEGTTTLFTMRVILHSGGLGFQFDCESARVKAYDTFMPEGWLLQFMERVAAAVADNKKMYKLLRKGTKEIAAGFGRMRADLKTERGGLNVD